MISIELFFDVLKLVRMKSAALLLLEVPDAEEAGFIEIKFDFDEPETQT